MTYQLDLLVFQIPILPPYLSIYILHKLVYKALHFQDFHPPPSSH
jgi:hypothetical protein